jgi:hypothetical protein
MTSSKIGLQVFNEICANDFFPRLEPNSAEKFFKFSKVGCTDYCELKGFNDVDEMSIGARREEPSASVVCIP